MKADLIIPTFRPDESFCLLLQKLREQTFVIQRMILLNTEKALWEEALKKYPIKQALLDMGIPYTLIHVKKREFDHGGTRMLGARESDAEILIFMTQDAVFADRYTLERLLAEFDDETVAAAYARQLPKEDCDPIERFTRKFNYPPVGRKKGKADIGELGIKTFFCSDVCAAYRRDVFLEQGGFASPLIFGEDILFAAGAVNQGYQVAYAAKAKVYHSHNDGMKQQFRRNFDIAVSQAQHPEVFGQVSAESEGMKLVRQTARHLFRIKKPWLIVSLFFRCAGKYAGFLLGKRYAKLGRNLILACTGNPNYWRNIWSEE